MKKTARAFIIVGIIANLFMNVLEIIRYSQSPVAGVAIFIFVCLMIASLIIGICSLSSLSSEEKSVALGVLSLIFVSVIAGIIYLCWQPSAPVHYYSSSKPAPPSHIIKMGSTVRLKQETVDETSGETIPTTVILDVIGLKGCDFIVSGTVNGKKITKTVSKNELILIIRK